MKIKANGTVPNVVASICLLVAIAACGSHHEDYETVGDFVDRWGEASGGRGGRCGQLAGSFASCVNGVVADACATEGVDCGAPIDSRVSDADLEECVDDTRALPCDATALPASCNSIGGPDDGGPGPGPS